MFSYMIFSDPEGRVMLKMERIIPDSDAKTNITGAWMANILGNKKVSEMIEIG